MSSSVSGSCPRNNFRGRPRGRGCYSGPASVPCPGFIFRGRPRDRGCISGSDITSTEKGAVELDILERCAKKIIRSLYFLQRLDKT